MSQPDPVAAALDRVRSRSAPGQELPAGARVALHFHPEADATGAGVLESILERGQYVSQFVTGTSNGGLTAFPGGDRWNWEQRMFGGAYDHVDAASRPVYGALDLDGDPYGPAPRFGSAHLRLRPETLARSTFAYPDSTFGPELFGVADRMGLIAEYRRDGRAKSDEGSGWCRDPLDHYIEAHVHGGVRVPEDVEALVIDPSFDDHTVVETAGRRGLVVETHPGYVAGIAHIAAHPGYRGQDVADFAERIAEVLANSAQLRPIHVARARRDWDLDRQQIKKVWHCLARFGRTW
ncbi:DUF3626 domain-containing protein [Brevibacterium renqingii]|uniref:DUF3626 domain-containing protein n=1 Tax=Brevibacterium renqingii TaxID=2776916 RepID=UPI001ADF3295|nr:DUF3626 domain-containing protein [Brevibacterium renqingii]